MSKAPTSTALKQGFEQRIGSTGNALFVLGKGGNQKKSMELIQAAKLRPIEKEEIMLLLMNDEKLKESLKGQWFYIAGKGLDQKLDLYTIDDNGSLVERKEVVSVEKTVCVFNGPRPLSVFVYSDSNASDYGRRFLLNAGDGPGYVAPVVVGVAKNFKLKLTPSAPSREAAAPKIDPKLLARAESSIAIIEAAEEVGALAKGITAPLKDLLRVTK
jgi:hypothetical protein